MYRRIVVKVGSSVIANNGVLDLVVVSQLVQQIVALRQQGIEIVFVTSGAVATGRGLITLQGNSSTVQKQMYAAVGQVKLMSIYAEQFAGFGLTCAQVLMTEEDFVDSGHYQNMQNCLENLLHEQVIPIVNENDVTAITELIFTDNDGLAGLVAEQLHADAVIILTSVEGLLSGSPADPSSQVIPEIDSETADTFAQFISNETSAAGRGGMHTKFATALRLAQKGIVTYIANGKKADVLLEIIAGKKEGTKFLVHA